MGLLMPRFCLSFLLSFLPGTSSFLLPDLLPPHSSTSHSLLQGILVPSLTSWQIWGLVPSSVSHKSLWWAAGSSGGSPQDAASPRLGSCDTKEAAHPEARSGNLGLFTPAAHAPYPPAFPAVAWACWNEVAHSFQDAGRRLWGTRRQSQNWRWERRGGEQGREKAQIPNPVLLLILKMTLERYLQLFILFSQFNTGITRAPCFREIYVSL